MRKAKTRFRQFNTDERGLSLVELIVTILLMSVISSMIVLFISSSRSNYELISTESSLQTEAQAATGFIYDILLEAEDVKFYENDEHGPLTAAAVDRTKTDEDGKIKVLSTKNGSDYLVVLYEEKNHKLRYASLSAVEVASSSAVSALHDRADSVFGDKYALLADYVTNFSFSKMQATGASITYSNVNLDFEYAGRSYHTTIDVNGRNSKEASD